MLELHYSNKCLYLYDMVFYCKVCRNTNDVTLSSYSIRSGDHKIRDQRGEVVVCPSCTSDKLLYTPKTGFPSLTTGQTSDKRADMLRKRSQNIDIADNRENAQRKEYMTRGY